MGFSDLRTYSTAAGFKYASMPFPTIWGVQLTRFRAGVQVLPMPQWRLAKIDIGTDFILAYEGDYQWVLQAITEDRNCGVSDSGMLVCDCTTNNAIDDYPTLYFTLGDIELTLTPYQYFYQVKCRQQNSLCLLLMYSSNSGWVLGSVFSRVYYSEFDPVKQRIGFAPSLKSTLSAGPDSYLIWEVLSLTALSLGLTYFVLRACRLYHRNT